MKIKTLKSLARPTCKQYRMRTSVCGYLKRSPVRLQPIGVWSSSPASQMRILLCSQYRVSRINCLNISQFCIRRWKNCHPSVRIHLNWRTFRQNFYLTLHLMRPYSCYGFDPAKKSLCFPYSYWDRTC